MQTIDFHVRSDDQRNRRQVVQARRQEQSQQLFRSREVGSRNDQVLETAISSTSSKSRLRELTTLRAEQPLARESAVADAPSSPTSPASMSPQARPSIDSQQGTSLPVTDSLLKRLIDESKFDRLIEHLKLRGTYSSIVGNRTVGDLAAEKGNCLLLDRLHESLAYDFDRRNKDGLVPFHYAVKKRQLDALTKLIELGASADLPLPSLSGRGQSDTPLHQACSIADTKLLNTLLDHCRASLNVVDAQGNSPLHRACLEDSLVVVKILMPHITEPVLNMQGFEGKTALHIAVLNQNREIVRLLLTAKCTGALVDIPADNGKTVIDIILELNNHMMLNDFIYYYTVIKMKGVRAQCFKELSFNQQFGQYLDFLANVDNEFRACIINMKEISADERQLLCEKLRDDDRIDLIEFTEVILQLLQTEDIHDIIHEADNDDVLIKIVENIVHYVLFREDAMLLERIMTCGVLWSEVSVLIEKNLDSLYLQAPEREVNGIIKHFRTNFVENEAVDHKKLAEYYGDLLSCYRLKGDCEETNPDSPYMRNPFRTLPVWSILSGRLCLTELLLQQEKFDVVPLSLFCAGVLRTFPANQDIVVDEEDVEDMALTCERFARKVVEKAYTIDTSYNRTVSLDYLLRPMESYGGVSCVRLAASNGCAVFLQSELCQHALDKLWFDSLLYLSPVTREVVIWMGAIPMNIFVPILLSYFDSKEVVARQKHEERPYISDRQSAQKSAKFHLLPLESVEPDKTADSTDGENLIRPSVELKQFGNYLPHRRRSSLMRPSGAENDNQVPLVDFGHDEQDCQSQSTLNYSESNYFCHFSKLLINFYRTPGVKFRYHVASHIVLLGLMSYFLLVDFKYEISNIEIIVYLILGGLFLEEMGEMVQYIVHNDIQSYFNSKWNVIDLSALLSGATGFVIRLVEIKHNSEWSDMMRDFEDSAWYSARIFLSICCTLYWIRLLYISNVLENLGPKLRMIAQMITKDLLPFLLILFIFILGFGVLMHSLLYPNGYKAWNSARISSTHVLLGMLKICFYSMVGEYSLDTIIGDDSCENVYQNYTLNEGNCPHKIGRYLVPYLILPLYVIVTEILLLNLIIAMFSKTIETIDSRSTDLWQFERHDLVMEFQTRSSLPPPLNVFDLFYKLLRLLRRLTQHSRCVLCSCVNEVETVFSRRVVLQFLLFQALSLRNNRLRLMQQSLPKQETEAEKMLMKMRKIVESELTKLKQQPAGSDRGSEGDSDSDSDPPRAITANTLLGNLPRTRLPRPSLAQTRWRQALRLQTMWR